MRGLRALIDLAGAVLDAVADEYRLHKLLADLASEVLDATASISVITAGGERLPVVINHDNGLAKELRGVLGADTPGGEALGATLQTGTPILIMAGDNGAQPAAAILHQYDLSCMAVLPVHARDRLIGALILTRTADKAAFSTDDIELGLAMATMAATTITNARTLADSAAAVDELRAQGELMDHISEAMISCDADRLIVSWNFGAEQIYGYPRGEALGCDLFALLGTEFRSPDDVPLDLDEVIYEVRRTGSWRGELRQRRADGAPLTIMSSITALSNDNAVPRGFVTVNRDVSEQRREEHRALHDALTGLPNRRMLTNRLYDALARSRRTEKPLAVLFVDLDKFKPINDTYGHAAGDEVLRSTARQLAGAVRTTDTVSRLGGDEFVVVLEDAGTIDSVHDVVTRVLDSVAELVDVGTTAVSVTASIGVMYADSCDNTTPEELIEAADEAMYVAKRERCGVVFANQQELSSAA